MNKFMVLVVEDDKLIQNLMSTTLDIHNYRYLTASTATDALLQITSHNPDVIFIDRILININIVLQFMNNIKEFSFFAEFKMTRS